MIQQLLMIFFSTYDTDISLAIDNLFKTNEILYENKIEKENISNQIIEFTNKLGNYHGYELIKKYSLKNKVYLYTYVLMYERQPIRFTFVLYKPNKKWKLYNFRFDVSIIEELLESTKLQYLEEIYL